MTLVEFVRARLAEDERAAQDWQANYSPQHPTLHDPARVLRQVAAMRKIANEHAPRTTSYLDAPDELSCRRCGKADEYPVPYPCPTLQSLATVYADRDGYGEWAP